VIRPIQPHDAQRLFELFAEPSLLTCDHFEPYADLSAFHSFANKPQGNEHRLALEENGQLIGLGILARSTKPRLAHSARLHLMFPDDELTDRHAAELIKALLDLAINWLNLKRLEIDIPAEANLLQRSLEQAGFDFEGLMKRALLATNDYQDELAMARLIDLGTGRTPKREPAQFSSAESEQVIRPSDIVIRPMAEEDVNDLYEIFRAPQNCRTTLQLPSQERWLTRQRILEPPAGMMRLVAVVDRRVVGMISLRRRSSWARLHVAGLGMMVHPDFWGQKIGSRLMEEAISRAGQWPNLKRLELQVHTDNSAAIHLYEKFGFTIEGTKRFNNFGDGGWVDTFVMARIEA